MNKEEEIEDAISELNTNVDEFIKNNEEKVKKMGTKIIRNENNKTMPFSENIDGDVYEKSDFNTYIRRGLNDFYRKSLSDKNGTSGGYFIPQEIALQINDRLKLLSPMRAISRTITISSNSIDLIIDSKMPDVGWGSSNSESRTETDSPEIRNVKIQVHEVYANPKVDQKLLDDSQINIEEWLTAQIAEKVAALENNAFINGNGKDKPLGFLQAESTDEEKRNFGKLQHFHSGTAGKFADNDTAVDILIDVICSLKPIYVRNAKWIMSRSALAEIRKLKNKDGMYLWQPSLSEASPSTLLGYPVIIDDDMPALTNETESISAAFGDFYSGYQIVDRQGLKILRDPYTSKPFVEFYATKRTGGQIIDFDAIKLLKFSEKSE